MRRTFLFLLMLMGLMLFTACTPRQALRSEPVSVAGTAGDVDLILFGCRYHNDPETVAILDRRGDAYTFDVFSPDFNYRVEKGLPAGEALEKARAFIRCSTSYFGERLSSLVDYRGGVLGYELRPLYFPLTYGVEDILETDYRVDGDKVVVRIRLLPSVENMFSDGDGRSDDRDR